MLNVDIDDGCESSDDEEMEKKKEKKLIMKERLRLYHKVEMDE